MRALGFRVRGEGKVTGHHIPPWSVNVSVYVHESEPPLGRALSVSAFLLALQAFYADA